VFPFRSCTRTLFLENSQGSIKHVSVPVVGGSLASKDTLPEWSKGVDSSSTSASCMDSNPTGVILLNLDVVAVVLPRMEN
jgi:hypothetical protein